MYLLLLSVVLFFTVRAFPECRNFLFLGIMNDNNFITRTISCRLFVRMEKSFLIINVFFSKHFVDLPYENGNDFIFI